MATIWWCATVAGQVLPMAYPTQDVFDRYYAEMSKIRTQPARCGMISSVDIERSCQHADLLFYRM